MQLSGKSKRQNAIASGEPALLAHIRAAIAERGPVTFAWFMEQALYHRAHGYYSAGRRAIGRAGDYFTSVSVGPLFGRLMAAQFAGMWEILGRPNEFKIVEQGAHGGEFARDVLAAAREHDHDFFAALACVIVEPFESLRKQQARALAPFKEKVTWRNSVEELEPFRGVHFSNELIDSMPVHLLKWTGSEWRERHVAIVDHEFEFVDLAVSNSALAARARQIPTPLPDGYETEVNLAALGWIEALAQKLTHGFVLAVDYGFARDEFYAPHRTSGTLQCYRNHRVLPSPFEQIGQCDLTAHVDWTSLAQQAQASGLECAGFADQHHFITGLLSEKLALEIESSRDGKSARALQTLLHPGFLGMKFQFLVLSKNVPGATRLSGLRFARDGREGIC